ncbi:MAG: hypothetical protein PHW12_03720, partial [Smithella sp.]|nr:hypothetical protein [Smithella sp.]
MWLRNSLMSFLMIFFIITKANTAPYWPLDGASASWISSTFGPRANNSWFHTGFDLRNTNTYAGTSVTAPFDMLCVVNGPSGTRLVFYNTAYDNYNPQTDPLPDAPEYVQFEHVDASGFPVDPIENVTTVSGDDWFCALVDPGTGEPVHCHMDAWAYGSYIGQYYADKATTDNPLQWWPYTTNSITCSNVHPNQAESWPSENGNNYLYFTINQGATQFTLNEVSLTLTDDQSHTTDYFLNNNNASLINFNTGASVFRDYQNFNPTQMTFDGGVSVYAKESDGVKIGAPNFNRGDAQKTLLFRYYLKNIPTHVQVVGRDVFGTTVFTQSNDLAPAPVAVIPNSVSIASGPTSLSYLQSSAVYTGIFYDGNGIQRTAQNWSWNLTLNAVQNGTSTTYTAASGSTSTWTMNPSAITLP